MTNVVRRSGYIRDAWLVILLGLVFGGGLAGVQGALSARIAENKKQETYRVIPELVSGAEAAKTVELLLEGQDGREARVYKVAASDGTHRGWVLPAYGQGFADRVEVLIGLDAAVSTITGLYVLEQKETPGLGDYITGESFRNRFRGKPTDMPVVVVKGDPKASNEVRALTGATISSESVATIVNEAVANMKGAILKEAGSSRERE